MSRRVAKLPSRLRALRANIIAKGRRSFVVVSDGHLCGSFRSWKDACDFAIENALSDALREISYSAQERATLQGCSVVVRSVSWSGFVPSPSCYG